MLYKILFIFFVIVTDSMIGKDRKLHVVNELFDTGNYSEAKELISEFNVKYPIYPVVNYYCLVYRFKTDYPLDSVCEILKRCKLVK